MKKIVPFSNVLKFNTDVHEITSISLEHKIQKEENAISGVFYISGEYKITDAMLEKEKFNFELPFDIALSDTYELDTLFVDIDDFRYELLDKNNLKVNIDMYIDGQIITSPEDKQTKDSVLFTEKEIRELTSEPIPSNESNQDMPEENNSDEIQKEEEPNVVKIHDRLDLLDEMLKSKEEEMPKEEKEETEVDVTNNNIFSINNLNNEEKYVTYRIYRVLENDSLDKILEKYNISKEELTKYNNIEDIKTGDKLIIPANNK